MATTALDLIKGALRRVNSYQSGETLDAMDANDALETLNDLLDSWSTDEAYVYGSLETIVNFTPGKYQYTIGPGGDFAIDNSGASIARPLRITNAFTRITTQQNSLDYGIEIIDQNRYASIGFKGISAPWPIALYYNATMPTGNLYFYQNPSSAGELHLYTDTILTNLVLAQNFVLPQGYARAIKWALAKELAVEYGFPLSQELKDNARESMAMIKSLNAVPVPTSNYDSMVSRGNQADAAWILTGGFR